MDLFSVDIGYVLLLRTASDSSGDGVPPYGIALRKIGRVRLERAYSPKVWLAMRYSLRGQSNIAVAYSALASFRITPGGLAVSAELVRLPRIDTVARLFNSHARIIREYSSSAEIR